MFFCRSCSHKSSSASADDNDIRGQFHIACFTVGTSLLDLKLRHVSTSFDHAGFNRCKNGIGCHCRTGDGIHCQSLGIDDFFRYTLNRCIAYARSLRMCQHLHRGDFLRIKGHFNFKISIMPLNRFSISSFGIAARFTFSVRFFFSISACCKTGHHK